MQLRLTSQLVSTKGRFIRTDAYSLDRTEIEALNREGNQCDDDKVSVNLEKCYMQYTLRQVVQRHEGKHISRHLKSFFAQLQCTFPWWAGRSKYEICKSPADYRKYRRIHHSFYLLGEHELYEMTGCLPGRECFTILMLANKLFSISSYSYSGCQKIRYRAR